MIPKLAQRHFVRSSPHVLKIKYASMNWELALLNFPVNAFHDEGQQLQDGAFCDLNVKKIEKSSPFDHGSWTIWYTSAIILFYGPTSPFSHLNFQFSPIKYSNFKELFLLKESSFKNCIFEKMFFKTCNVKQEAEKRALFKLCWFGRSREQ